VLVVAIDDVEQSLKVVDMAKEHFPHLHIVARARNVTHYYGLRERGVTLIERETLDSALMSGRSVLELLGWQPHQARNLALRFRKHSIELLEEMRLHREDEAQLIAVAKQGRQQLEQLWAKEREEAQARKLRPGGWSPDASGTPGEGITP
jgi:glutathione-regulated potassium-efflux system ancillary protein KefC